MSNQQPPPKPKVTSQPVPGSGPAGPTTQVASISPQRTRSPNYPAIPLREAVEKSKSLYAASRRHSVGVEVVASTWGNSPKSSTFKLHLAAVQYFGLLAEDENGGHKLFKLTPLALDIVADYSEGSPQHKSAIKQAALLPKLHLELWSKWGANLPPDEEIRRYLVRERGFNDKTVDEFIEEYKETLSFANVNDEGKIKVPDGSAVEPPKAQAVRKGSLVQWVCMGSEMFDPPREVLGLSDDNLFAFVPETDTGIPVDQLTVVGQAMSAVPEAKEPPVNPFKSPVTAVQNKQQSFEPPPGFKEDAYDLTEGRAVFRWPEKLDPDSVAELEDWFGLLIRKMQRMTGAAAGKKAPTRIDLTPQEIASRHLQ